MEVNVSGLLPEKNRIRPRLYSSMRYQISEKISAMYNLPSGNYTDSELLYPGKSFVRHRSNDKYCVLIKLNVDTGSHLSNFAGSLFVNLIGKKNTDDQCYVLHEFHCEHKSDVIRMLVKLQT